MMIKCKQLDLENTPERLTYNKKLQEFEKEFTYPLGDKFFYISHGRNTDYFTFFENLGKTEILVLEKEDKIIGVVCLILRNINGKNTWYACDFKISKEFRGQKLYRKWMWKFFLPFYLKCQTLYGINMSSPKGNKLLNHTQSIFKVFSIGVKPFYLYEFAAKEVKDFGKSFWNSYSIITNNGVKDIIIDGQSVDLYHIVATEHLKNNLPYHKPIDIADIPLEASMMFLSPVKMNMEFAKETVISLIHRKNEHIRVCSAEI